MKKCILTIVFGLFTLGLIAQSIYLSGTMNSWDVANPAYQLVDNGNGVFYIAAPLAAGTYGFKLTDGTWGTSIEGYRTIILAEPTTIKIYAKTSKRFVCDTQDEIFITGGASGNQGWGASNMIQMVISGQQATATTSVYSNGEGNIYRKDGATNDPLWQEALFPANFTFAANSVKKIVFDFATYSISLQDVAIYVSGTMNSWAVANPAYKLVDNGNGVFYIAVPLSAGTYNYKLTDGTWGNSIAADRVITFASAATIKIYAKTSKNFVCDTQDTIFITGGATGNASWGSSNMIQLNISGQQATATCPIFSTGEGNIYRKAYGTNDPLWLEALFLTNQTFVDNNVTKKIVFDFVSYSLSLQDTQATWNGTGLWSTTANWSIGYEPTGGSVTVSSGELTIDKNVSLSDVTITSGAKLTLNSTKTLNISGNFTINSAASNGTGTFKDENTNGGLNVTGTTTVNQSFQHPASTLRTWYITPPVASATPTPTLSVIKSFDEALNDLTPVNNWVSTLSMVAKKGYQVVPALAVNDIAFTGSLNQGNQNITLTSRSGDVNKAGFNLIGNPYPSYLDWVEVMANSANVSLLRSTTMWYRTKASGYTFWTVNGAGVSSPSGVSAKIPPMQAFWVRANAGGGDLALTSTMRSHAPTTDKLLKAPSAGQSENTLIRIQVSNGINTDEVVIYTSTIASNGLDMYDSPKMSNENASIPEIFTTIDTEKMVINSMRNLPLDQEIAIGFISGNAALFTIKANEISNLPANVKVMLKDNVTFTQTDITDGAAVYTFVPKPINGDRFSIIFRSASIISAIDKNDDNQNFFVYKNTNNQIAINTFSGVDGVITVSNSIGQKLINTKTTGTSTMIYKTLNAGVYFVTLNIAGNNTTKKVIIN